MRISKKTSRLLSCALLGFACAATLPLQDALALKEPRPISSDRRIRTILYSPNEVFRFKGHYGYQSTIEFSPEEEIQTISIGDSIAWQIVPSGHRIFIKPVEQDALTNMTVITNKRTYQFELHADEAEDIDDKDMIFVLRFVYGGEGQDESFSGELDDVPLLDMDRNPEKYNFRYSISGAEEISPIRIFDDGEFTYFEFADKNADVPAFFMVDRTGNESIINYRTRGDFIVVERVASQFTLRLGPYIVCVYNDAKPLRPMVK